MQDYKLKFIVRKKRHRYKISLYSSRIRLSVFRSNRHIYAQIIDDAHGKTLVSASTAEFEIKKLNKSNCNIANSMVIGKLIGQRALDLGLKDVVFDRGGYKYHGVVKSLADSAREFLNF
jgi:large subunit ribosomal protein L18